jgi:hypothetical protein
MIDYLFIMFIFRLLHCHPIVLLSMSATAVKATEQNHYDIIVPRNNGQMYKQPTSHILHESHSVRYWAETSNGSQKACLSSLLWLKMSGV